MYLVDGIDVLQQIFATFFGQLAKVSGFQNGISTVKVKVRFSTQLGTLYWSKDRTSVIEVLSFVFEGEGDSDFKRSLF